MQYFKPFETTQFAGDCMPFFHDGVFHLFYLQDENHHGALGGLGGHQWAHATTTDLIHWTHHPLAIAITQDWEGSICTGSTFFHEGTYYGFYATRRPDWTQHLALATSTDGITFHKCAPNPLASPPQGYHRDHYRDPFVFWDARTQRFHMLVTAMRNDDSLNRPDGDQRGCLAHLTSPDLHAWEVTTPFLVPGLPGAPECPDYFFWRGWYYLVFSNDLITRYRMSRDPLGPWLRPPCDVLDSPAMRVMKTAAFTGDRRIGAAWVGTREHDQDSGRFQWGGHVVLREIIQHADGTLGTQFVPELIPATGNALPLAWVLLTDQLTVEAGRVHLSAGPTMAMAQLTGLPRNCRITARIHSQSSSGRFGLHLRAGGNSHDGYALEFDPVQAQVKLFDQTITHVEGLSQPFTLDLIVVDDLIDVCIDQRRCIINRCPTAQGDAMLLFAQDAQVTFENVEIRPIQSPY